MTRWPVGLWLSIISFALSLTALLMVIALILRWWS